MARSFEGTLADIPFMGGVLAARRFNEDTQARQTEQQMGQLGMLQAIQRQQQQQALQGILTSDLPDDQKMAALSSGKAGVLGIQAAHSLAQVQQQQATLDQNRRATNFRRPGNLAQFMTPGQPAIPPGLDELGGGPGRPAQPGQIDPQKLLSGAVAAGLIDPLAYAREQITENKPHFAPRDSPGYYQNGRYVPTPVERVGTPSPLARLLSEKQALLPNDPRHKMYDAAITHATNPQAQRIIMPSQEPPVQTYTDGDGKLWERKRGGGWTPAVMGVGQPGMVPRPKPGAAADKAKATRTSEENKLYDSIDRQIDELATHVKNNEGTVTGTVGPKGLANRIYEVAAGAANIDVPTPALDLQNKKELIIANARKLVAGGGVFTNKDAERVEAALGTGFMANPNNTARALADLKVFIKDKRGQTPNSPRPDNAPKAEDFFRPKESP